MWVVVLVNAEGWKCFQTETALGRKVRWMHEEWIPCGTGMTRATQSGGTWQTPTIVSLRTTHPFTLRGDTVLSAVTRARNMQRASGDPVLLLTNLPRSHGCDLKTQSTYRWLSNGCLEEAARQIQSSADARCDTSSVSWKNAMHRNSSMTAADVMVLALREDVARRVRSKRT